MNKLYLISLFFIEDIDKIRFFQLLFYCTYWRRVLLVSF